MNKEERNEYLFDNLSRHYDYVRNLGYDILYIAIQGSPNYNLDIYTDEYRSDVDTKAIILPSIDDFINGTQPVSTTVILPNNEHCDIKDIRVMFDTIRKQNINFVEILFSQWNMVDNYYSEEFLPILLNRERIARFNFNQALRCMAGMSKEKLNALEHPYPNCIDDINKYGYCRKQLHHIARMNDFIKKYVQGEPYQNCLIPDNIEGLMDLKIHGKSLDIARELAYNMDSETYQIKEDNLSPVDVVDSEVADLMDTVKLNVLKKKFKNELIE